MFLLSSIRLNSFLQFRHNDNNNEWNNNGWQWPAPMFLPLLPHWALVHRVFISGQMIFLIEPVKKSHRVMWQAPTPSDTAPWEPRAQVDTISIWWDFARCVFLQGISMCYRVFSCALKFQLIEVLWLKQRLLLWEIETLTSETLEYYYLWGWSQMCHLTFNFAEEFEIFTILKYENNATFCIIFFFYWC